MLPAVYDPIMQSLTDSKSSSLHAQPEQFLPNVVSKVEQAIPKESQSSRRHTAAVDVVGNDPVVVVAPVALNAVVVVTDPVAGPAFVVVPVFVAAPAFVVVPAFTVVNAYVVMSSGIVVFVSRPSHATAPAMQSPTPTSATTIPTPQQPNVLKNEGVTVLKTRLRTTNEQKAIHALSASTKHAQWGQNCTYNSEQDANAAADVECGRTARITRNSTRTVTDAASAVVREFGFQLRTRLFIHVVIAVMNETRGCV